MRSPHKKTYRLKFVLPAVLLALLLLPPIALADAPGTRGEVPQAAGSTGMPPTAGANRQPEFPPATIDQRPEQEIDRRRIPKPAFVSPDLAKMPQSGEQMELVAPTFPIARKIVSRSFYPGEWLVEGVAGASAYILKVFNSILALVYAEVTGAEDLGVPQDCNNTRNFVFCTPPSMTYYHPAIAGSLGDSGARSGGILHRLQPIAIGLVTLLFAIRLGRLILEGQQSLAMEGKRLILGTVFALMFVGFAQDLLVYIFGLINAINSAILRVPGETITLISAPTDELNLAQIIVQSLFWLILMVVIFKSFIRIAKLLVLIAVAPLAGALIMEKSTMPRFVRWFSTLVDTLLEQTAWIILFVVANEMVEHINPGQNDSNGILGPLQAIATLLLAISGGSILAIAGTSLGGAGTLNYVGRKLARGTLRGAGRLAGGAMRGLLHQASGRKARGAEQTVPSAASWNTDGQARATESAAMADPQATAAAQRLRNEHRQVVGSSGLRAGAQRSGRPETSLREDGRWLRRGASRPAIADTSRPLAAGRRAARVGPMVRPGTGATSDAITTAASSSRQAPRPQEELSRSTWPGGTREQREQQLHLRLRQLPRNAVLQKLHLYRSFSRNEADMLENQAREAATPAERLTLLRAARRYHAKTKRIATLAQRYQRIEIAGEPRSTSVVGGRRKTAYFAQRARHIRHFNARREAAIRDVDQALAGISTRKDENAITRQAQRLKLRATTPRRAALIEALASRLREQARQKEALGKRRQALTAATFRSRSPASRELRHIAARDARHQEVYPNHRDAIATTHTTQREAGAAGSQGAEQHRATGPSAQGTQRTTGAVHRAVLARAALRARWPAAPAAQVLRSEALRATQRAIRLGSKHRPVQKLKLRQAPATLVARRRKVRRRGRGGPR